MRKGNKPFIRITLISLLMLCFVLAFDIVIWYLSPESVHYTQEGESEGFTPADGIVTEIPAETDSASSKNVFRQVDFNLNLDQAGSIRLLFHHALKSETIIKIFCISNAGDEEKKEESKYTVPAGLSEFAVNLSGENRDILQINTDIVDEIDKIIVSEGKCLQYRTPYTFRTIRIIISMMILTVLLLMWIILKRNPSVLKTQHWFSIHVVSSESRYAAIDIAYIIYACLMLLHHIRVCLYYTQEWDGSYFFHVYWIVFAAISIILGRMWKNKGFWILVALSLIKYIRTCAGDFLNSYQSANVYMLCIYAFFGCYAVGSVLNAGRRKLFIQIFCALWTIGMTVLYGLGIYVAWTDSVIRNLSDSSISIYDNRLKMFYHMVDCGILGSVSIAVSCIGFAATKNKIGKALYFLGIVIIFIASTLTGTRTGYVILAAEISIIVCIILFNRLKPVRKGNHFHLPVYKWLIILCVFILITTGLSLVQPYVIDGFNSVKEKGIIQTAQADNGTTRNLNNRGYFSHGNKDLSLNGRIQIWESAIQSLQVYPQTLLYGMGIGYARDMEYANKVRESQGLYTVTHAHNVLIQTVLEIGLPGLLLYLSVLLYFIFYAIKVLTNKDAPLWERMLPIPVLGSMIGELVDITTYVNSGRPQLTIMYLFLGLTVAVGHTYRQTSNTAIIEEG